MPVAYMWGATGDSGPEPVLDMLVADFIAAGSTLAFRFYPHTEGYLSANSTSVSFVLDVDLQPSNFIRLSTDSASNTMTLNVRAPPLSAWSPASAPSAKVSLPAGATVYVFLAQCGKKLGSSSSCSVCAFGVGGADDTLPIFPPTCVLNCKYTYYAPFQSSGLFSYTFYYFPGASVPKNWMGAWQIVRAAVDWKVGGDPTSYYSTVDAAENLFNVSLIPGQLLPVGFRPYSLEHSTFPGQWALVATSAIPANTVVYMWCNKWSELTDPTTQWWYKWTSPLVPIAEGYVVNFGRVGGVIAPFVNCGTIVLGPSFAPASDIFSLTAYSLKLAPDAAVFAAPITATYTCSYFDIIPDCLVPGVSIRSCLWPSTASIISLPNCRVLDNWQEEQAAINQAPLVGWIDQPTPSYIRTRNKGCATGAGGCCQATDTKIVKTFGKCGRGVACGPH